MARQKKNRTGARRQQQRKGRDIVYSKLTLLLVFFKSVAVTSVLVAGLVYCVHIYRTLHQPEARPFNRFELIGEFEHLNKQLFQQRLEVAIDGGYFALDLEKLKVQLEQEAWVYRVDLTRAWPDTLVIQVEEQQAIAFWGESNYLNQYGEQFPISGERLNQSMPYLGGEDGREIALIDAFVEYNQLFKSAGLSLKQLSEDARHDQRLLLADGTLVALGREQQLERVKRFAGVYNAMLAEVADSIAALDLRYSHGFSVSWKENSLSQLNKNNKSQERQS